LVLWKVGFGLLKASHYLLLTLFKVRITNGSEKYYSPHLVGQSADPSCQYSWVAQRLYVLDLLDTVVGIDAISSQMCKKWMDIASNSKNQSAVIDIPAWISRASLDSIGQGKITQVHILLFTHFLQLPLISASAPVRMMKANLHAHTPA